MVVETVPKDILDLLSSANLAKAATISYGAVSVGDTATVILVEQSTRTGLIIVNNSTQTVYLGGDAVSTANGLPLVEGASYGNQDWVGAIYGIVAAGTSDVRVEDFY
ncbi:hypothetical protein LCGC14_2773540 [marine sediment metagenome]|uniref:Uncharacterized protein n=1 Tax=marine sediment metagenome TaxID=412755 RepID=A0A0F9B462_9ZZZZ